MHGDEVMQALAAGCAALGFDLVQPFAVADYNEVVAPPYRLPDFGRRRGLGALVAHTRALWEPFCAAWRRDAALQSDADPLDRYTQTQLTALVQRLPAASELHCAHEPEPRRPAIQRLAELSGLAPLSLVGLNVHPVYGTWIGLRAAIAVDCDAPLRLPEPIASPCADCARTCVPAFERARLASGPDAWRAWLAVRDACPIGRAHRYGAAQIAYHYTKDRRLLG